jgi:hypothetical protein
VQGIGNTCSEWRLGADHDEVNRLSATKLQHIVGLQWVEGSVAARRSIGVACGAALACGTISPTATACGAAVARRDDHFTAQRRLRDRISECVLATAGTQH